MSVAIRLATRDDAAAIHAMVAALGRFLGQADRVASRPADFARDGFGADPAFEALIAEDDRGPLGLALYFPEYSTWRGRRGVYLQDLYVEARARGTGLGRRLVAALARRARGKGAAYMRLSVDVVNADAPGFYAALGFREATEDRMFRLDGAGFEKLAEEG